jgi:8-oxo-dGTP pyrophosphatase MutT (NUDIX family)
LCHATQPNVSSYEDCNWTVPKGQIEDGETALECAIRETYEETGLKLLDYVSLITLENCVKTVLVNKKKDNYIFTLETDDQRITKFDFKCTSIIDNPDMPHMNGLPEVDRFGWFSSNECKHLVFKSLKQLF